MLRTIECLLGLAPMNQYDAFANPIGVGLNGQLTGIWQPQPRNTAGYTAVLPPKEVICEVNPPLTALKKSDPRYRLAKLSLQIDFSRPDVADPHRLNEVLWKAAMGPKAAMPAPRFTGIRELTEEDEDEGVAEHGASKSESKRKSVDGD